MDHAWSDLSEVFGPELRADVTTVLHASSLDRVNLPPEDFFSSACGRHVGRENGQPFAHVGPCRDRDAESNKTPTNEKRPNVGPQGRPGCQTGCLPYAKVNLPRSAFLNREFFPLALISRASAEYKVARGVLPAGDFQ